MSPRVHSAPGLRGLGVSQADRPQARTSARTDEVVARQGGGRLNVDSLWCVYVGIRRAAAYWSDNTLSRRARRAGACQRLHMPVGGVNPASLDLLPLTTSTWVQV